MKKEAIRTGKAPAAVGPYSQAVRTGEWLFVSGQIPLDPKTGDLIRGGMREQTQQALKNLGEVLVAAGLGPDHVVKTTVYLRDMTRFGEMNEAYAEFFGKTAVPPARAALESSALPKGVLVEVEAIARDA